MKRPISVLKFGSSVLEREADLVRAVHAIFAELRAGHAVIAVVSALGNTTDELLAEARSATFAPDPRVLARLLATGEARAAALLSLAVERAGLPVGLLGAENAGILTEGPLLDAAPIGLDEDLLHGELAKAPIVVLPGFVGRRVDGELSLLGRGGSDLTAVYVAGRLGAARCILFKDVDGLFEWDPAQVERGRPRRFANCTYADVLALPEGIVQHKAVTTARALGLTFEVGTLLASERTRVSAEPSTWAPPADAAPVGPLRVALLGLGTVGGGVLQHLCGFPDGFEVRHIVVRDLAKHTGAGRAADLGLDPRVFTTNFADVQGVDLVIEALGGVEPAADWIAACLKRGVHVVTANKAAVAARVAELEALADQSGAVFATSAAVGGVVPALETARRLCADPTQSVRSIEGVLNGTSSFVLDRLALGEALGEAVAAAQERGFAEADPTLDLDGSDVAHKLELLARATFGPAATLEWQRLEGLAAASEADFAAAQRSGGIVRLVARATAQASTVMLEVGPQVLAGEHPLGRASGASNGVCFELTGAGVVTLTGAGAGRWPTAESVMGDVLELVRARGRRAATATQHNRTER